MDLHNHMVDVYLNNALNYAVERETFDKLKEEEIWTRDIWKDMPSTQNDMHCQTGW